MSSSGRTKGHIACIAAGAIEPLCLLGWQPRRLPPSSGKPGEVELDEKCRRARAQRGSARTAACTNHRRTGGGGLNYSIETEHIGWHDGRTRVKKHGSTAQVYTRSPQRAAGQDRTGARRRFLQRVTFFSTVVHFFNNTSAPRYLIGIACCALRRGAFLGFRDDARLDWSGYFGNLAKPLDYQFSRSHPELRAGLCNMPGGYPNN